MKYSVVIPVYKNEASIPRLLTALEELNLSMQEQLEVVFVVDGSPDNSYQLLAQALPQLDFPAQLLAHSRNFGSFPAIRTGLQHARGEYFAVMAADLQEPPELLQQFFDALSAGECDVAIGARAKREDPWFSQLTSRIFWALYRRWVVPEMPVGGVDMFGCNRKFRDSLLKLEESRSSLIALVFWLGFERKIFFYIRQQRQEGVSAWTWRKKVDYMLDSVFAFSDLPIRLLMNIGALGCLLSACLGSLVLVAHLLGYIRVPGYAGTVLVVLFFGMLNLLALGVIGAYAWRAYENSKQRPHALVAAHIVFDGNQ